MGMGKPTLDVVWLHCFSWNNGQFWNWSIVFLACLSPPPKRS
jgi:hypothetical protein